MLPSITDREDNRGRRKPVTVLPLKGMCRYAALISSRFRYLHTFSCSAVLTLSNVQVLLRSRGHHSALREASVNFHGRVPTTPRTVTAVHEVGCLCSIAGTLVVDITRVVDILRIFEWTEYGQHRPTFQVDD